MAAVATVLRTEVAATAVATDKGGDREGGEEAAAAVTHGGLGVSGLGVVAYVSANICNAPVPDLWPRGQRSTAICKQKWIN